MRQAKKPQRLQWHPALYAGIQIELEEEAENLIFENEHQLGKKPMEVDVLIIKKAVERQIRKNIGRIFRKYNIVEYKSPTDYLSVDDFYKVYAYTCFYKADTRKTDSVRIGELTMTFICASYPGKLMRHLQEERKFRIENAEAGIYYVYGDIIPMQVIVQKELSDEENLWLKSLTDKLESQEEARKLVEAYRGKNKNHLYEAVMDIVVRANQEKFKEEKGMCEALKEIMADVIEEEVEKGKRVAEKRGEERGEQRGKEFGQKQVNDLISKLSGLGRIDDIVKSAENPEYQKKLFEEFGL